MSSQYIQVNQSASPLAASIASLSVNLRAVQDATNKCKDIGDQVASGGDYVALGAYLGISEANAQIVYNLLAALAPILNGSEVNQFIDRIG